MIDLQAVVNTRIRNRNNKLPYQFSIALCTGQILYRSDVRERKIVSANVPDILIYTQSSGQCLLRRAHYSSPSINASTS